MYDIIIKGGTIIDGTGKERFRADIGIEDGKITKIGDLSKKEAKEYIEVWGKFVCPGFIDILSHSDSFWTLFTMPKQESLVYQGITTILGGNCGSSLAPLVSGEMINSIQKWADIQEVNVNWQRLSEFLSELERRKIGINFGTLVGHSTLRRGIVGDESRYCTDQEVKVMAYMLEGALDEGAFGMSTGLAYSHSRNTDYNEILSLAEIVKKRNALYSTHMRDEGKNMLASVNEVLRLVRDTGVNTEISHFKVMEKEYWPNLSKAISMLERVKKEGIDLNYDCYPYATTNPILYILLPAWVAEGGKKEMLEKLRDPIVKEKVINEMRQNKSDYEKIVIAISPADKTFLGKNIVELAKIAGAGVEETIVNILIASEGRAIAFMQNLSEDNVRMKLAHPMSIVTTGGAGYNEEYRKKGMLVHPKCFGSAARFLGEYVREQEIMSWEDAVQKLTGAPAQKIGLKNRGVLQEKMIADITVFDPDEINDEASFTNPYQYAKGINYVIINGRLVIDEGEHTDILAGKVLRREV